MKLLGGMALGLVVGGSGAFADDNPPAPGGMMPAPQPPEPIPPKPDDEKPEGDNKEEKKPEEGDKPTDPDYVTGGVMVEPEDPPPPPEPEKEPSKEYELDGDVALPREPEPDK